MIDHDNDLISNIDNLNVNDEFSFFDFFEQSSYDNESTSHQNQFTQRRFRKSIFKYQLQTAKKTIKSRVFFDVSQFLQLDSKITNDDKINYILQKIKKQKSCLNIFIDVQDN